MKINWGMIIIIILLILLIIPMCVYNKKSSPYLLTENFKNKKNKNNGYSPLLFKDTAFKPECCPNTYSNSMGCACMTVAQQNYLKDRGGNNVPYSEY
jgi:hypothetical protein